MSCNTVSPTGAPGQEHSSMEGFLEYAVSLEKLPDNTAPSANYGDESRLAASIAATQPKTFEAGQEQRKDLSTLPKWRKVSLFSCSCMLQFLLQLDMAAVAVTIPKIAEDMEAKQIQVFAVATGYLLAQTVFQLVFSHVSHVAGRKSTYMAGLVLYLVGAIAAAAGPTMDGLIGARVVQGIGAAGMSTMSAIVVVDITQPRQRAGWQALSQSCGALGNICGPLVAGLMFQHLHTSWHSIFVIEAVVVGVLLLALACLLPSEPRGWGATLRDLASCDWVGMLAFFICSVLILVPINIGGTLETLEWTSAPVLVCFAGGILSLLFLIFQQLRKAERPAFPREIFERPVTNVAFLGNAVCGVLLTMIFYNLVLFLEVVRRMKTMEVGKMLLSVTLTYPTAYAVTGLAIRRWGRIKWATISGAALSTVGLGMMQFMTERTPPAALVVICMCAGAGCGMFAPAMVNTVLASTDSRWHPHAIAMRTLLYTAGQCVGVSIGLAIFTNAFSAQSASFRNILSNPQELIRKIKQISKNGKVVKLVVGALRWVWGFACILALVTGVVACYMGCPDLPEDSRTTEAVTPDEERQDGSPEMTTRK